MRKIINHNLIGLIRSSLMKFNEFFFFFFPKTAELRGAWHTRKPGIKLVCGIKLLQKIVVLFGTSI